MFGWDKRFKRDVAWVVEDHDPCDSDRLTGLFSAELQGESRLLGPRGTSLDEALAWARSVAKQVVVSTYTERFSAGSRRVRGHPIWPPANLRVRPRFSYEPIDEPCHDAWWVRLSFDEGFRAAPEVAQMLAGDSRVLSAVAALEHRDAPQRASPDAAHSVTERDVDVLIAATGNRSVAAIAAELVRETSLTDDTDLALASPNETEFVLVSGPSVNIMVLGPGPLAP